MYVELWYEYQRDLNADSGLSVDKMRGGSIFDMQINKCKALCKKIRTKLVEHIQLQFRNHIKMYIKKKYVNDPTIQLKLLTLGFFF